jgi:hypothetical protein
MPSIDHLSAVDTRREHMLAILGHQLMGGTAIPDVGWVQLQKNNVAAGVDDQNVYETDWTLTVDGQVVGYLDTEEKTQWRDGDFPYPRINVAKHPMSHWRDNRFDGRMTNKLRSFAEMPAHSWWLGVRTDWQRIVMVNAQDLFTFGQHRTERTRYSDVELPVISLRKDQTVEVSTPEMFTQQILFRFEVAHAAR